MNLTSLNKNTHLSLLLVFSWIPLLFFDSVYFNEHYFDGKIITTVLVIAIVLFLIFTGSLRLKTLMFIMIPLSWLGEYIFCDLFDMYDYRDGTIPLYVPFGHAGIFTLGWLLTQKYVAYKNPQKIKKVLTIFYVVSFSFVVFILKDTLSLFLGVLFFIILKRKNFLPFYLIMSLVVLYLELIGTFMGVWKWDVEQGMFQTVNPPLGAIFIYVGGDLTLGRLTRFLLKKRRKMILSKRHKKSLISNTDKA